MIGPKLIMKFRNVMSAMKKHIIYRVIVAAYEYVHLLIIMDFVAIVETINVGQDGNLHRFPDDLKEWLMHVITGTTKANVHCKNLKIEKLKVYIVLDRNLWTTRYHNAKYVKKVTITSLARDVDWVFHAVVVDTFVLVTTNLATTLVTTATNNLRIRTCRIIPIVKMRTALH